MARIRRYLGRVEVWLDKNERASVLATIDALTATAPTGRWVIHRGYDDPAMDADYQRHTAPELDRVHEADIGGLRDDLQRGDDRCRLDEERALTWLRALNRLRLVAGSRLGIESDGWELGLSRADLERDELAMMGDLGFLQQGILDALER